MISMALSNCGIPLKLSSLMLLWLSSRRKLSLEMFLGLFIVLGFNLFLLLLSKSVNNFFI